MLSKQLILNTLNKIFCFLTLLSPYALQAQNTIGGQARTITQAEAERQSMFVDAERERLLGHYDEAVSRYKKFTYDNPDNPAAWYGLSRAYYAQNDLANALDAVAKAVEKDPQNEWYQIFQADIYEKNGRVKDAVKIYESLTARFPQTIEFLEHLAYLSVLSGDPQGGLRALEKKEKLLGIDEETSLKKHMIYVGMGEDKKAAAELQKLADAYPVRPEYRHRLAEFYEAMGDKVNARKVYEEILRRNPDDKVAQMSLVQKEKNGADAAYLTSLKPLSNDPKISIDAKIKEILPFFPKLDAGNDAALTQNLLELGALIEKAHPDDPKAWSLSGDLLYHAGQPDEALVRYRKCIALNPAVFSVWENTLDILHRQKNHEELLRLSEQAIDAFPNQPKAYLFYGMAATEKGQYEDAIAQLEQAWLMTGSNPALRLDITDQIGLALIGKKDFAAAIARYEQSLAKAGDQHPAILEHYGDALFLDGDRHKAMEFWQKANAIRKSPELEQKIASGKL